MYFKFNKYLTIITAFLCFSNISFASSVIACGTGTYDYGDANVSSNGTAYGEACHDTNRWQQLGGSGRNNPLQGDSGDTSDAANNNKGWSGENSQRPKDSGDNGVKWRVQNADGSWPDDFSRGELLQGSNVEFEFKVKRSDEGNHEFDQLKAWTDWNGNGIFENTETIIDEKWYKNHNEEDILSANSGNSNSDLGTDNNSDTWRKYYSEITVPIDAVLGDTWMRARITCENSLNHDNNYSLEATGYYHQGEVEDYKVAINQVPEPTTLLVFGSALIGLVLNRKKST